MRKIYVLLILSFIGSAFVQTAYAKKRHPAFSIPSGIYSNVTESEESGDRGGVEFRFYADTKPAYVEAVVCESECNGEGRYYVTPTTNGFSFIWKTKRYPEDSSIEFYVSKENDGYWIAGADEQWERRPLNRVKKPLGLLGVYKWAKP
jgi:hypothetical protein